MSTRTEIENLTGFYYITFTCYKWIPMFSELNFYDRIYHYFTKLIEKGETISAYVIMPNHLHFIMFHEEETGKLKSLVSNLKRFLAYEIVEKYKSTFNHSRLAQLSEAITEVERKKNQLHRVFENSFDVKWCASEKFIIQKLNYIHNNPIQPKWNLATIPSEYFQSSALFYETGNLESAKIPLVHWQQRRWQEYDKEH